LGNVRPRYNDAPSQEHLVIRENHKTGERSLDVIKWGLIPHWCQDLKGGRLIQSSRPLRLAIIEWLDVSDSRG
jgi:putative SOS response-associated peptidase YedK